MGQIIVLGCNIFVFCTLRFFPKSRSVSGFSVFRIILAHTKKISISEWCKICGWSFPMFWWKHFFLSCPVQTWDANVCLYMSGFLCANLNMQYKPSGAFFFIVVSPVGIVHFSANRSTTHGREQGDNKIKTWQPPEARLVSSQVTCATFLSYIM